MGARTRALKLDEPTEARRFREWVGTNDIKTRVSTTTRITGPDDGGTPLVYFGARDMVRRTAAGDRASIVVESRDRRGGRGLETTGLRLL